MQHSDQPALLCTYLLHDFPFWSYCAGQQQVHSTMSADIARGTDAARTGDKPIEPSAFQKAITQDIAESLDQAKPNSTGALAALVSGPLLMTETISELDNIPDAPFDQICNDGSGFSSKNFLGKLTRYILTPIKEVYLPLMTWGLPTNFLMVRLRYGTAHTPMCTYTYICTCTAAEVAIHHNTPNFLQASNLCTEPSRQQLHAGCIWRLDPPTVRVLQTASAAVNPCKERYSTCKHACPQDWQCKKCYPNAYTPPLVLCCCRLQLTFRTFNRDFGLPNHNADDLAPLLRDSLMPARGKMHREKSAFLKWKTSLFDLPLLGLPGIVNFIGVCTLKQDWAALLCSNSQRLCLACQSSHN